jgi:hypothetical protein
MPAYNAAALGHFEWCSWREESTTFHICVNVGLQGGKDPRVCCFVVLGGSISAQHHVRPTWILPQLLKGCLILRHDEDGDYSDEGWLAEVLVLGREARGTMGHIQR